MPETLSSQEKLDLTAKFQLIIQEALQSNDSQKLQRMMAKMRRMGLDMRGAEELVKNHGEGATQRKRRRSNAQQREAQEEEPEDPNIPRDENYMLVEKILKISDYYQILQVERNGSITQSILKRKYRKLAMKLHPDSNKHRKATEAFQKVQKAYATLSDDDKKRLYDEFGTDDRSEIAQRQQQQWTRGARMRPGASPFGNGFVFTTGGGGAGVDLGEEILRQFFGGGVFNAGGMGGARRRRSPFDFFEEDDDDYAQQQRARHQQRQRRHQQQAEPQQEKSPLAILLSLLPFMLLFLIPLLMQFQSALSPHVSNSYSNRGQQYFTFQSSGEFTIPRETFNSPHFGTVKYFVTKPFNDQYASNYQVMRQIDESVFAHYREHLRERCTAEKRRQANLIAAARKMDRGSDKRREFMTKAQTMTLKSCKILASKYGEQMVN